MLTALESFGELTIAIGQGRARLDVTGCTKTFCNVVQRNVFDTELVLLIAEVGGHISKLVLFGPMNRYWLHEKVRTTALFARILARRQATAT